MKSLRESRKNGFVINAKDLRTDIHTGTQMVNIDENARINNKCLLSLYYGGSHVN